MSTLFSTVRIAALFLVGFSTVELFIGSFTDDRFLPLSHPLLTFLFGIVLLSIASAASRHKGTSTSRSTVFGLMIFFLVGLGWMGWRFYEPDGSYTASYDFSQISGTEPISGLEPGGRVSPRTYDPQEHVSFQEVRADLAYFTVDLPRAFADIAVTIEYENPSHQALNLGLRTDVSDWSFENRLIELQAADKALSDGWEQESIGGTVTQLTDPAFSELTLPELAVAPDVSFGLLNAPRPLFAIPETPYPRSAPTSYEFPLRGSHDFYIHVPEGEALTFDATFDTLDPAFDMPPLSLSLHRFDKELVSVANTFIQDPERKRIYLESEPLSEGIYRLHVSSTDRVLLRTFDISHPRFVFKSLTLAASPDYLDEIPDIPIFPSTLYTTSTELSFQTVHEVGLQTLLVDGDPVEVGSTHTFHAWTSESSPQDVVRKIDIPVSDVSVSGNEWLSFSPAQYFDPDFETVFLSTATPEEADILSVLLFSSTYSPVVDDVQERVRTRTATFPLHTLQLEDPTSLQFVLSSAGFQSGLDPIRVERIQIEATKPPLSLKRLWQRITNDASE